MHVTNHPQPIDDRLRDIAIPLLAALIGGLMAILASLGAAMFQQSQADKRMRAIVIKRYGTALTEIQRAAKQTRKHGVLPALMQTLIRRIEMAQLVLDHLHLLKDHDRAAQLDSLASDARMVAEHAVQQEAQVRAALAIARGDVQVQTVSAAARDAERSIADRLEGFDKRVRPLLQWLVALGGGNPEVVSADEPSSGNARSGESAESPSPQPPVPPESPA